eukprot:GHVQ01030513.1.p1 GENE.GHVQ01030513.1~~GHVQ01030513.1.p1  ORF type:complete len:121 (+),score=11.81 GHVQ01030513.1:630-992(+)
MPSFSHNLFAKHPPGPVEDPIRQLLKLPPTCLKNQKLSAKILATGYAFNTVEERAIQSQYKNSEESQSVSRTPLRGDSRHNHANIIDKTDVRWKQLHGDHQTPCPPCSDGFLLSRPVAGD